MNSSISSFKRFILYYCFPGLLGLTLFFHALDYYFTKYVILRTESEAAGYTKINRLLTYEGEEIPILGSSRALNAYIPDSISPLVYNYGLFDASFLTTNAFLNIELKKKKKSPVIIDIVYWDWYNIGDVADYIPFSENKYLKPMLKETGQYKNIFAVPGLKYFGFYPQYMKEYISQFLKENTIYSKGYIYNKSPQLFDNKNLNDAIQIRLKATANLGLAPGRVDLVDNAQKNMLIKHVKSNPGRHFYLIISPFHRSFFDSKPNLKGEAVFKYLSKFPNVTYLDFSKADYPDSLFLNTTHLNQYGAERLSKELSLILTGKKLKL